MSGFGYRCALVHILLCWCDGCGSRGGRLVFAEVEEEEVEPPSTPQNEEYVTSN